MAERAKRRGMAAAEIQISETETPLHKLETVYRRLVEQLATAAYPPSALREIVDAWFYTLEEDVLAEGAISADDGAELAGAVDALMERRLADVARTTPAFAAALRAYRKAVLDADQATAQSLIAWIGGQPNVAAAARRAAGVKGDLDPARQRSGVVLGVLPSRDDNQDSAGGARLEGSPDSFRIENAEPRLDLELDYVGSIENATKVIAALHRGEKRLVFADSKRLVEMLGAQLRAHGVTTYLVHASLSLEERRRSEQAFAEGRDCVIVSTSALELGIDVGDLDRVIQVNAPPTVAAFLQRLGRGGRRAGTIRNMLFLALDEDQLLPEGGHGGYRPG
jgi:hypothetical protein